MTQAIGKITGFGGTCNPTAGLKEVGEPEETLQGNCLIVLRRCIS